MRVIAGLYKNRRIKTPKGLTTRPTSEKLRASFFNRVQNQIEEAEFLDLFAGSGAMGLEAISRGASKVVFVDSNRDSIQCIKENLALVENKNQVEIIHGDVFATLEKLVKQKRVFDIIYADPPYEMEGFFNGQKMYYSERLLKHINESLILKNEGQLFIEDTVSMQMLCRDLEHLKFFSSRQFGGSVLYNYVFTT